MDMLAWLMAMCIVLDGFREILKVSPLLLSPPHRHPHPLNLNQDGSQTQRIQIECLVSQTLIISYHPHISYTNSSLYYLSLLYSVSKLDWTTSEPMRN